MKRLSLCFVVAASLNAAVPAALQAVAVPPELIQNEPPLSQGTLYGMIFLVFVFGFILGVWLDRRLS